ncbi:MAG TPA: hypothetical protein VM581_05360, partial [Magnetospirillaceae bacterium]|nr:hypothetical protein [Magnetospirillaceae bacterium]
SAKFAMKLLGLSIKKVATLSSKSCGLLTRQHVPGSHGEIYIVTESLMALMAAHVATGTAEDWWRLRVRNNFEPLLTLETIRTTHTVHERTIRSLIDDGTFPCLYVPGTTKKITRVSQHAVEMWAWQRTRISNAWLSFICGAPLEQVAIWADNKQFCRLKHGRRLRADACPSLGCITEYIATHQTMTFDPEDWITQCLEKRRYPVPISNLSIEDDNELKKLRGLRLPDGSVVVMHADAVAQQARAGLAARTRFLTSPLHKA